MFLCCDVILIVFSLSLSSSLPSLPQSVEDKYSTVKVLNQKLESAILSLHGRTGVSYTDITSS